MLLKFTWEWNDSKIAKALLKEKNVGAIEQPYMKPNSKAYAPEARVDQENGQK